MEFQIISKIRRLVEAKGFIEVETPVLQVCYLAYMFDSLVALEMQEICI